MKRNIFVSILLVALVLCSWIAYKYSDDGFLIGNILPEMIGVLVELLIILVVIDRWQKNEEKNRKIKIERRLREFLIFFLKDNFDSFPSNWMHAPRA